MLDDISLTQLLLKHDIHQKEKILLILYASSEPLTIEKIKERACKLGLLQIQKWNLSDILKRCRGLASQLKEGWLLTPKGKVYIEGINLIPNSPIAMTISTNLRSYLPHISSEVTRSFVEEAIRCYEAKLYRAAIVLSWAGAMHILREYVVKNKLGEFNSSVMAKQQFMKKFTSPAKDEDDVGKLRDVDFFEVLDDMGLIDKSVKINLQNHADTRNACAHPSSLTINETQASALLDSLIVNIFQRFT